MCVCVCTCQRRQQMRTWCLQVASTRGSHIAISFRVFAFVLFVCWGVCCFLRGLWLLRCLVGFVSLSFFVCYYCVCFWLGVLICSGVRLSVYLLYWLAVYLLYRWGVWLVVYLLYRWGVWLAVYLLNCWGVWQVVALWVLPWCVAGVLCWLLLSGC